MKKYFLLILFIAIFFGISNNINAQGGIGDGCEKRWEEKEFCSGNIIIKAECDTKDCLGISQETSAQCKKMEYECLNNCWAKEKDCVCRPDPSLGSHLQYTIADTMYMDCRDACDAEKTRCEDSCFEPWGKCEGDADKDRRACDEIFYWFKTGEEDCGTDKECVQSGDNADCKKSSGSVSGNKNADDYFKKLEEGTAKLIECQEAVRAKYINTKEYNQHGYWGGCEYSPGLTDYSTRKCVPGLQEDLDDCERKYPLLLEEALPVSGSEYPQSGEGDYTEQSEEDHDGESAAMAKELVRAEFEKAKSDLEKIKQSNDQRWADKKNFAGDYNTRMKKAFADVSPDEADRLKEINQIVRTGAESGRDLLTTAQDVKDYYTEYRKTGSFSDYGGMGVFSDTAGGMTDFLDMIDEGTSTEDAITRTVLDNYGVSLLTSIPVLKAWDVVASSPDKILKSLGISKKNWSRKATIAVGEVSPSGVIKTTTRLMNENSMSDIDNALIYQMGKVRSADGVWNTTVESAKLVAGAVGAFPVATVRAVSDAVGGTIFVGQKAAGFVYDWFAN